MTTLLDILYEDTRKKVMQQVNFKNPDSLITISMDAWQAPTGDHIRNYMWVTTTTATVLIMSTQVSIISHHYYQCQFPHCHCCDVPFSHPHSQACGL